ncbi:MAG: GNAT family N-acetyltransferase [Spirochaetaceae bacterium]|nr:GNAT family N-acetyltransferase [Spirochaetaceae bacterium]
MKNIYDGCPKFENVRWLLRFVEKSDSEDLLKVYGDKNALPFFNSDNCDGDNFYYHTKELMDKAIDFWLYSYREKWFVRWAIIDKATGKAIGTIESFKRLSEDDFNESGVLRLDVGSSYERAGVLEEIMSLIVPHIFEMFDCKQVVTKVPVYAVERAAAAEALGFEKTDSLLVAKDGVAFNGYWILKKK